MEKVLVLYDSDSFYATRFMEYVNKRKDSGFTLYAFTKKESLEEYLRLHTAEILLSGEEIPAEEAAELKVRYIYLLSEQGYDMSGDNPSRIFKYQSAGIIMKRLLTDYEEKESLKGGTTNAEKSKLLSVFAPMRGAAEISFAWSLSLLMAEKESTLLILLDPLPVPLCIELGGDNQSLTEFIYYLKEGCEPDKIKELLWQSGRLFCLSGLAHGTDILSLNKEDICKWTQGLRRLGDYANVVFFLGCYSEGMLELMKESDRILTVSPDQPYAVAVTEEWERQMCHSCTNNILDKIRYMKLPQEDVTQKLPLTPQRLKDSTSWTMAKEYLS